MSAQLLTASHGALAQCDQPVCVVLFYIYLFVYSMVDVCACYGVYGSQGTICRHQFSSTVYILEL